MKILVRVLAVLLVCIFASFSNVVAEKAETGLVGHWSFDDVDGKIVKDSSGSGNDGTLMETAKVVKGGILGRALSMDGKGYVEVPSHTSLENQEFTISFWMKTDDHTAKMNGGISKGLVFGDPTSYEYEIFITDDICRLSISNGTQHSLSSALDRINDNNWHLWTAVVGPKSMKLYRDGIQRRGSQARVCRGDPSKKLIIDYSKHYAFYIGGSRFQLKGLIDEVRIYNRALTGEEIKKYYDDCFYE